MSEQESEGLREFRLLMGELGTVVVGMEHCPEIVAALEEHYKKCEGE